MFTFLFLPVVLFGYHQTGQQGHYHIAIAWLVGASLFFYGWWNPAYLGLILTPVLFNYGLGVSIGAAPNHPLKQTIFIFGVAVNLELLGYFKYANFFVVNFNRVSGSDTPMKYSS
jgi:D-alanyl-lipoteichoic acid acyltransferase DltB (MBOAT superfamily)